MCFSAGASFTAGALLTFVGTETIRKVHKPEQIVFASIPVYFAFQQVTEGVLWLALADPGAAGLRTVSTFVFLIMAQVIWPVIIPLSVLLMERNRTRRRILTALLSVGTLVAGYYLYRLLVYPAQAEISRMHLAYQSGVQDPFGMAALSFYSTAALVPFFISSIKRMYILGTIMFISFIVSAVFYTQCLTSVWCFFAAVISFAIFYVIRDAHQKHHRMITGGRSRGSRARARVP